MNEHDHAGAQPHEPRPSQLKAAVRRARIESAERTGVVVDMHDAELARLEILNEALEPVFADVAAGIDIFDRAVTPGEPPRLWVDMLAHVVMGRDKRVYRFLQDTRYGRRVLAESAEVDVIVEAVTDYVARRLVERERALAGDTSPAMIAPALRQAPPRRRWKAILIFLLGMLTGVAALLAAAWFLDPLLY